MVLPPCASIPGLAASQVIKLLPAGAVCATLTLVVVVFGASATLAQTKAKGSNTATGADQVPFTAAMATIAGVTHIPGGLTQINFNTSGNATYLGDFTGPLTRLQDNQGTSAVRPLIPWEVPLVQFEIVIDTS